MELNWTNCLFIQLGLYRDTKKWQVWIDAGMHAREWIGPTTAIYVAQQVAIIQ